MPIRLQRLDILQQLKDPLTWVNLGTLGSEKVGCVILEYTQCPWVTYKDGLACIQTSDILSLCKALRAGPELYIFLIRIRGSKGGHAGRNRFDRPRLLKQETIVF